MSYAVLLALLVTPPADPFAALEAKVVRPVKRELHWQQIPWQTDGAAALEAARAESRPLLVWLAGGRDQDGSPLERC